jgi:hypothetical protein
LTEELFLLPKIPLCFPSQALPQAAILHYGLDDPYVEIVHQTPGRCEERRLKYLVLS